MFRKGVMELNWSEKAFQQAVIGLKKSLDKAVEISFTERGYKKVRKIQLTQEQEDALKHRVKKHGKDEVFKTHNIHPNGWLDGAEPLNKLSVIEMAKVLYAPDSYEVIPQYKIWDWVFISMEATHTRRSQVRKVTEVKGDTLFLGDGWSISSGSEHIRHATPEEIQKEKKHRFWSKLGREVDEYRKDDLVRKDGILGEIIGETGGDLYRVYVFSSNGNFYVDVEDMILITQAEQRLDK